MCTYLTAEVCLNGHPTTDRLERSPERASQYCPKCGKATIDVCQNCKAGIRGEYYVPGVVAVTRYKPPRFCYRCGSPFPWTVEKISAAKELADELDELTENDRETLKGTIDDLSADSPRTEIAARRYRRVMAKAGKGVAASMKHVMIEVATEVAKRAMFGE